MKSPLPTAVLFDIPLYTGTKKDLIRTLTTHISSGTGLYTICTPNPEQMVLSWKDAQFRSILQTADINLPDGAGVVWAIQRNKKARSITRIAGREVFHDLLENAKHEQWRVFLLGGKKGSAEKVVAKWKSSTAVWFDWQYDAGAEDIQSETQKERGRVMQQIQEYAPHLLFVAYGAPWQEKWVADNQKELEKAGVKIAMVVGGSFEYEAGVVPLPHPVLVKLNLEWLQRLIVQPWRWKRQLRGLEFFVRVLFS